MEEFFSLEFSTTHQYKCNECHSTHTSKTPIESRKFSCRRISILSMQWNQTEERRKKLKALIRLATTFAKRLSMRCDEEGVGEDIEISINWLVFRSWYYHFNDLGITIIAWKKSTSIRKRLFFSQLLMGKRHIKNVCHSILFEESRRRKET